MSRADLKRLVALETIKRGRPELGSMVMQDGETWDQLQARAETWRKERPAARRFTIRLIGVQE